MLLFVNALLMFGGQYAGSLKGRQAAVEANAKLARRQLLTDDEVTS